MAKVIELADISHYDPARALVTGLVWVGATSAGDEAIVRARGGNRIWRGRASGTHTYIGIRFPDEGILAPQGVSLDTLDSGVVFVYVREF